MMHDDKALLLEMSPSHLQVFARRGDQAATGAGGGGGVNTRDGEYRDMQEIVPAICMHKVDAYLHCAFSTGWSVYSGSSFCCTAILMFCSLYCTRPTALLNNRKSLLKCQRNLVHEFTDDPVQRRERYISRVHCAEFRGNYNVTSASGPYIFTS